MKNIRRKWWFWIIVLFIIGITIMLTTTINNSKGVGTAGINEKEFEEIQIGMTQSDVNKIIDKLDEWENDDIYTKSCEQISKSNKDQVYEYVYKYYGEKEGYVIITYKADYSKGDLFVLPEVTKKEQFNLK